MLPEHRALQVSADVPEESGAVDEAGAGCVHRAVVVQYSHLLRDDPELVNGGP
jgi:hypothetical protein